MNPIHIACQSTSQFAPDCAVMLRSLLCENEGEQFAIHFLHDASITAADRERLGELVTGFGAGWEPVEIPVSLTAGLPVIDRYGGLTVWFRLLLPRLLPDLERVLYLDADLLVLQRVRPLWETELGGACVAAVTQPLMKPEKRRVAGELGLPDPDRYFNTGVMVMDLKSVRESGLAHEAEQLPRRGTVALPWADQDTLNVVLRGRRADLHPRWNVMNPCFELAPRYLPWPAEQVAEAIADPAIIHFIGPYKPWHYRLRHPYAERWFAHLSQTPWRERPQEGYSRRHRVLRALPPRMAWRYEMAEWALARGIATGRNAARAVAKRPLAGNRRLYGHARAAYRLVSPSSAPDPLTDLLDAFADSAPGACFVQIGAGDAEFGDPLRRYVVSHGWHGVMVEPVPYVFERLRAKYAASDRVTLVRAAIADRDGELPFYYVAESDDPDLPDWYDKLGSLSRESILHPYHVEHIPDLAERIVCEPVPALTFETLWRQHPLPRLDLVLVDAEGHDDQILAQIDLRRHRPVLVIYEQQHLPAERRAAAESRLAADGYGVVRVGPDAVAYRRDAALAVRLAGRRAARSAAA